MENNSASDAQQASQAGPDAKAAPIVPAASAQAPDPSLARVAQLETNLAELTAANLSHAEDLKRQKAEHTDYADKMRADLELADFGLSSDEARQVARTLYQALPKESRPKTAREWLESQRGEGAKPHPVIAHYLGTAAKPVASPGAHEARGSAPMSTGRITLSDLSKATAQRDLVALRELLARNKKFGIQSK